MSKEKTSGTIAHAAEILICLSEQIHTISEISRQCQIRKSTVHRVLKLLEECGMVIQDPVNRHYFLGPFITRLNSNPYTSHDFLLIYAMEEMKYLAHESEETVTLDLMIGIENMPLFEIPSIHELRVTNPNKMGGLLHAGASRKVHLSQLNEQQLKRVLNNIVYTKVTEHTVTSPEILLAQIREIRKQGYAISYSERNPGVMCISAPIYNYIFPVTLSIIGPEIRLFSKEHDLIEKIKASANKISKKLLDSPIKGVKRMR